MLRLGLVILAAGKSARMGQPKLLLPWGATSVLGHLVKTWRRLGAEQIGVVWAANSELEKELEGLGISPESRIVNPAPERGMFSSLQCAASWQAWKTELTHWAIVLGDQPHIGEESLRRVLEASMSTPDKVCQPRQGGHRRHPVIMPKEVFREMGETKAANLKEFLDTQEDSFCELDDPALALDIDRMEDYERAKKMYFGP